MAIVIHLLGFVNQFISKILLTERIFGVFVIFEIVTLILSSQKSAVFAPLGVGVIYFFGFSDALMKNLHFRAFDPLDKQKELLHLQQLNVCFL